MKAEGDRWRGRGRVIEVECGGVNEVEVYHSSSCLASLVPPLPVDGGEGGKPKKVEGRPWTSLCRLTKALKEETQFPTKWFAWPRMCRST